MNTKGTFSLAIMIASILCSLVFKTEALAQSESSPAPISKEKLMELQLNGLLPAPSTQNPLGLRRSTKAQPSAPQAGSERPTATETFSSAALGLRGEIAKHLPAPPEVLVTGPDYRVTTNTHPQNETNIAGDPTNASVVIGGFNDYALLGSGFGGNGICYSANGGMTWTRSGTGVTLPASYTNAGGDPSIAFNSQGRAYYAHIASGTGAQFTNNNGVFVSSSVTSGVSWNPTVAVASHIYTAPTRVDFEDKEMIACDYNTGSAYRDRLYISWTKFYEGNYPTTATVGGGDIMLSYSTTNGASWIGPVRLSDPAHEPSNTGTGTAGQSYVQGSEPAVEADGDVYVAYWFGSRINVQRSIDGGATFTNPTYPFSSTFGVAAIKSSNPFRFRVNSYPNIETDPSRPNYVYVVATDSGPGPGLGRDQGDIIFARSPDNGTTWDIQTLLNDDASGNLQVYPWMAVDKYGNICVIWYDNRRTSTLLDVYETHSTDGGATWSANARVTDANFNPNIAQFGGTFLGDYNGLGVGADGKFHALWTDCRNAEEEIYYDSKRLAFACGDVFAAVSNGLVYHYDKAGNLIQALNTGLGGYTTGMAFDQNGDLYVTDFGATNVSKFNKGGRFLGTFGSGYSRSPESILFDAVGDCYVGDADGDRNIRKFNSAGTPLTQYPVATEDRGSDWIDLASDQRTMFYTSEGTHIKRYDVSANVQLPDFATLPGGPAYALRILPDGGVLVAATAAIYRLDAAGALVQTYDVAGEDTWFALNLDPDQRSFWSGNYGTSNFYQFDISTGAQLLTVNTGTAVRTLFGLTVYCELNQGGGWGSIAGVKFQDDNSNCTKDPGEAGLQRWTIRLDPGPRFTTTDTAGNYRFNYLQPGTYTISEIPKANWQQTCPGAPGAYTVNLLAAQNVTGKDFGNMPLSSVQDLSADIGGSRARPGFEKTYGIIYENKGTVKVAGTQVQVTLPPQVFYASSSAGGVHSGPDPGGIVTWNDGSLAPGFAGLHWVRVQIPATVARGTVLHSSVLITPTAGDANIANNSHSESEVVRGSYDPNEMEVSPAGAAPYGSIFRTDTLTYVIHFQNTGNDTAFTIDVRDALDPHLDISTVEPGASSHPYSFSILDPSDLVFTFSDIKLPDSTTNLAGSEGFVQFKVVPRSDVPIGTDIPNSADIFFDFNPPVNTNTVSNRIGDTTMYRSFSPESLALAKDNKGKIGKPVKRGKGMPNAVNALDEAFQQGVYPRGVVGDSAGGMTVGIPFMKLSNGKYKVNADSAKKYGWLRLGKWDVRKAAGKNYNDVLKTLYQKPAMHTGTPRGFGFKGQKTSMPPSKDNNKLMADLIALKVNILVSYVGKMKEGFGELRYVDLDCTNQDSCPLSGMLIREIAQKADSALTLSSAESWDYGDLDDVIQKINAAFVGAIDTEYFASGPKLRLKGVRPLFEVPFLQTSSAAAPRTVMPPPSAEGAPEELALSQNYPNPFNPTTTIQFSLQEQAYVSLKVYNVLGQEVKTLLNHELLDGGSQEVEFDASSLASSVYFYRLVAEGIGDEEEGTPGQTYVSVKKMSLMK